MWNSSGVHDFDLIEPCTCGGQEGHKEITDWREETSERLHDKIQERRFSAHALYCKWECLIVNEYVYIV